MAEVYEGIAADGGIVAIKLPHRELLDARIIRRFHSEAAAGRIVSHPSLVTVRGSGVTSDGIPYLIMDRVRGEPLGVRVRRDGPLSLRSAVAVIDQLLGALDAMHSAGIVHGDVKSDNLLVERQDDGSERAVLIDLGLAHVEFRPGEVERPRSGEALVSGTPDYMAPEVIRGLGSTTSSDLYATGAILYELIVGTPPFAGGSADEIIQRHLTDEVVPPSLRCTQDVPAPLERIVLRALRKRPAERFASARAFAAALHVVTPLLDDAMIGHLASEFSRDATTLQWPIGLANEWRR